MKPPTTDTTQLPLELRLKVKELVNNLETITYYKHHYVRKTGLKRAIKQLLLEATDEAVQKKLHELAEAGNQFGKRMGSAEAGWAHIRDLIQAQLNTNKDRK